MSCVVISIFIGQQLYLARPMLLEINWGEHFLPKNNYPINVSCLRFLLFK